MIQCFVVLAFWGGFMVKKLIVIGSLLSVCMVSPVMADLTLAKDSGCLACHSLDHKVIGPAWKDVAEQVHDRERIIKSITEGSKGQWVSVVGENIEMPAYSPRVEAADIEILADFIMSL